MLSFKFLFGALLVIVAVGVGAVATAHNIHSTHGPKERAFVIRVCFVLWCIVLSMLACMYFLPSPYRYVALFLHLAVSPILLYRWSTKHQLIRMLEQREFDEANNAGN